MKLIKSQSICKKHSVSENNYYMKNVFVVKSKKKHRVEKFGTHILTKTHLIN